MNTKELFLKLYKEKLTDKEIAIKLNKKEYYIGDIRRSMKLKSNKIPITKKYFISKEVLYDLVYNKKLSDKEIANIYNFKNYQTINYIRKSYNFIFTNRNMNPYIELTKIQKELIFGCTLGDGYIKKDKKDKNACFIMNHGIKQDAYIHYKFNFLDNIKQYDKTNTRKTPDKFGVYRTSVLCTTKTNESINEFHEMFYKNGKKIIPVQFLEEYYTPFAMAIHFCDDGSYSGGNCCISACAFKKEELIIFCDFLYKKYNLLTTIDKYHRIRIKASSINTFINLIKPYIIKEMEYKLVS